MDFLHLIIIFLIVIIIVAYFLASRRSKLTSGADHSSDINIVRSLHMKMPELFGNKKEMSGDIGRYKILSTIEFLTKYPGKVKIYDDDESYIDFLEKLFPNRISEDSEYDLVISYLEPTIENLSKVAHNGPMSVRFYPPNEKYFAGDVRICPSVSGTDTQLWTNGNNKLVIYPIQSYLNKLAYVRKMKQYGYDYQVEKKIINEFKEKIGHIWIEEKIKDELDNVLKRVPSVR